MNLIYMQGLCSRIRSIEPKVSNFTTTSNLNLCFKQFWTNFLFFVINSLKGNLLRNDNGKSVITAECHCFDNFDADLLHWNNHVWCNFY